MRQYTPYHASHKTPAGPDPQARAPERRAARKALFFDAGDLLYFRPRRGERLTAFLADLGFRTSSLPASERERLRTLAFIGQLTKRQYQDALLQSYGVQGEENLARGRQILEEESAAISFFEGVRETLLALKARGLSLGVITDTLHPTTVKLGWFARAGIAHVWDAFVSSCEVGVRKPDPRIYQLALDQLGIQPHQAAFVGHKASELQGARAVGLTAVAFNYDADAEADFYLEHFTGLLDLPILPQIESDV